MYKQKEEAKKRAGKSLYQQPHRGFPPSLVQPQPSTQHRNKHKFTFNSPTVSSSYVERRMPKTKTISKPDKYSKLFREVGDSEWKSEWHPERNERTAEEIAAKERLQSRQTPDEKINALRKELYKLKNPTEKYYIHYNDFNGNRQRLLVNSIGPRSLDAAIEYANQQRNIYQDAQNRPDAPTNVNDLLVQAQHRAFTLQMINEDEDADVQFGDATDDEGFREEQGYGAP